MTETRRVSYESHTRGLISSLRSLLYPAIGPFFSFSLSLLKCFGPCIISVSVDCRRRDYKVLQFLQIYTWQQSTHIRRSSLVPLVHPSAHIPQPTSGILAVQFHALGRQMAAYLSTALVRVPTVVQASYPSRLIATDVRSALYSVVAFVAVVFAFTLAFIHRSSTE